MRFKLIRNIYGGYEDVNLLFVLLTVDTYRVKDVVMEWFFPEINISVEFQQHRISLSS